MKKYQFCLWQYVKASEPYDGEHIPVYTGRLNCETKESAAISGFRDALAFCGSTFSDYSKLTVQTHDGKTVIELDISSLRRY